MLINSIINLTRPNWINFARHLFFFFFFARTFSFVLAATLFNQSNDWIGRKTFWRWNVATKSLGAGDARWQIEVDNNKFLVCLFVDSKNFARFHGGGIFSIRSIRVVVDSVCNRPENHWKSMENEIVHKSTHRWRAGSLADSKSRNQMWCRLLPSFSGHNVVPIPSTLLV